ncbi:hypothetical protein [uncultured Sulfitobacter sp.]|uniref:hypothetical protein n=1 Tax=uncultured Sulfitobacter sp. TaxID=191468 RepID=UPI0026314725|nr:hypothetical protein [uncultured Sulfitobacter sp.]
MYIISKLEQTFAAFVLAIGLLANSAQASEQLNTTSDGLAMDGFDVISYFIASKPEKYEQRYIRWCANAVSKGYAADVDFVNGWAVIDGSLHLFWANGTKHNFFSDVTAKRVRAEDNWPTVFSGIVDGTVKFPRHSEHFESVGITHPQEAPEEG